MNAKLRAIVDVIEETDRALEGKKDAESQAMRTELARLRSMVGRYHPPEKWFPKWLMALVHQRWNKTAQRRQGGH